MDRVITQTLPNLMFEVELQNSHKFIAYTAGRMRRYRIRMTSGDRIRVELSPYDLNRGRIVYRYPFPHSLFPWGPRLGIRWPFCLSRASNAAHEGASQASATLPDSRLRQLPPGRKPRRPNRGFLIEWLQAPGHRGRGLPWR